MVMDLPTIHQLITVILQPTLTSVSGFIAGHICIPDGGGEDREASAEGASACLLRVALSVGLVGQRPPSLSHFFQDPTILLRLDQLSQTVALRSKF